VSISIDEFRTFFETRVPFNAHLGLEVTEFEFGRSVMRLPFRPEWIGDPFRPALHGGLISTLADAAGGAAVFSALERIAPVSTIDLRVDYLRPGLIEDVWCEAQVLRVGNRVGVTSMRILQGPERQYVTAEARGVYNIAKGERIERG
jgi:uncharacterized protein (TIGR00369 family)